MTALLCPDCDTLLSYNRENDVLECPECDYQVAYPVVKELEVYYVQTIQANKHELHEVRS